MHHPSVAPADVVAVHPWRRVVFRTYALSLSFFEAVILDALVRAGGGTEALVLADVHGVRESCCVCGSSWTKADGRCCQVLRSAGRRNRRRTACTRRSR